MNTVSKAMLICVLGWSTACHDSVDSSEPWDLEENEQNKSVSEENEPPLGDDMGQDRRDSGSRPGSDEVDLGVDMSRPVSPPPSEDMSSPVSGAGPFKRILKRDCALTTSDRVSCWRPSDAELIESSGINDSPRDWIELGFDRDSSLVCGLTVDSAFECFSGDPSGGRATELNAWLGEQEVSDFVMNDRNLALIIDGHLFRGDFTSESEDVRGALASRGQPVPHLVRFSDVRVSDFYLQFLFRLDDRGDVSSEAFPSRYTSGLEFEKLIQNRIDSFCGITRAREVLCVDRDGAKHELQLPDGEEVRELVPASGFDQGSLDMYVISMTGRVYSASAQPGEVWVNKEPLFDPIANPLHKHLTQIYAGDPSCGLVLGEQRIACFGIVDDPNWLDFGSGLEASEPVQIDSTLTFTSLHSSASGKSHCGVDSNAELHCWGSGFGVSPVKQDFSVDPATLVVREQERGGLCGYSSFADSYTCTVSYASSIAHTSIRDVSVNLGHVAILQDSGELHVYTSRSDAQVVTTPEVFASISSTNAITCGIGGISGEMHCGFESRDGWRWVVVPRPVEHGKYTFIESIASTWNGHATTELCAGVEEHGVYCNKADSYTLRFNEDALDEFELRQVLVDDGAAFIGASLTLDRLCAFDSAGEMTCKNRNSLAPFSERFEHTTTGTSTRCGLDGQGHAWCWGTDARTGALGRGLPLRVSELTYTEGWESSL